MEDIVPGLLETIEKEFAEYVSEDKFILELTNHIRDGTATQHEVSLYARKLGDYLSEVLQLNLTQDVLPDGRMYYNIADRIVMPMMYNNFNLTSDVAAEVQRLLDGKAGIGLNPIRADFPKSRVQQIVDSLTEEGVEFEVIQKRLGEPIRNCSQSFYDDFVKANAMYRNMAGMKTTIRRTLVGGACPYCVRLAGSFEYGKEPKDIYRRHDSCRCTVTYISDKKVQNVHTKQTYNGEELQKAILER